MSSVHRHLRRRIKLNHGKYWDFPGGPVVDSALPLHGARVSSLVGELRSHIPRGRAKKKIMGNKNILFISVCLEYFWKESPKKKQ